MFIGFPIDMLMGVSIMKNEPIYVYKFSLFQLNMGRRLDSDFKYN